MAHHLLFDSDSLPEPARLRTVLNRAYYAPFLAIKKRVEAVQGPGSFPHGDAHGRILRALSASRISEFTKVLNDLRLLREAREDADYELGTGDHERVDRVEELLERSRRLTERLLPSINRERFERLKF